MPIPEISVALIALVAFVARGQKLLVAAILFVGFLIHLVMTDYAFNAEGVIYYASGAALCLSMVVLFLSLLNKTSLVLHISVLLTASIVGQFIGWILYESYSEPVYYNAYVSVVNAAIIIRLLVDFRCDRGSIRKTAAVFMVGLVRRRHTSSCQHDTKMEVR